MEKARYSLLIRESHLDTFGHVNNATYLQLYEEARWEWITKAGYGLEQVQKLRKGPLILGCEVQFKKELKLREPIVIETWIESYRSKISIICQEMINSTGQVASTARFTSGFFDLETRKLILPTPEWLKAISLEKGV